MPAKQVPAGKPNLIAVRVYDGGGEGGIKRDHQTLLNGNKGIKLEGEWQFRTGDNPAWGQLSGDTKTVTFSEVVELAKEPAAIK